MSRVEGAVESCASRWWDLESVVGGQHVFSSAVGLQGFCGVDILRQLRFTSHHGPLFPLVMLQLSDEDKRQEKKVRLNYDISCHNLLSSCQMVSVLILSL